MKFSEMTISEIVEWLESTEGVLTPHDLAVLRQDIRLGVRRMVERIDRQRSREQQEVLRISELWRQEQKLWSEGYRSVAGIDEAGRGPLAGPVVAAAVVFPRQLHITGVNDSKQLSPEQRELLYHQIMQAATAVGVGTCDHEYIDEHNILQATKEAMRRAVAELSCSPDYLLVDGNMLPNPSWKGEAVVKGDASCFSIAAASIIAKVTRDRMMTELHHLYPQYGFAAHKGYSCREHYAALEQYGACPIHRQTFLRKFYACKEEQ